VEDLNMDSIYAVGAASILSNKKEKYMLKPRFNETSLMKNNVHVIPNYHGWFTVKKKSTIIIKMEVI
jgi:hypothetical protein